MIGQFHWSGICCLWKLKVIMLKRTTSARTIRALFFLRRTFSTSTRTLNMCDISFARSDWERLEIMDIDKDWIDLSPWCLIYVIEIPSCYRRGQERVGVNAKDSHYNLAVEEVIIHKVGDPSSKPVKCLTNKWDDPTSHQPAKCERSRKGKTGFSCRRWHKMFHYENSSSTHSYHSRGAKELLNSTELFRIDSQSPQFIIPFFKMGVHHRWAFGCLIRNPPKCRLQWV